MRETAVTFDLEPFTPVTRGPWFAQFAGHGPHRLFVAERGRRLLGYACSHAFRNKAAYNHKFGRAWDVEWWQKRPAVEPGAV